MTTTINNELGIKTYKEGLKELKRNNGFRVGLVTIFPSYKFQHDFKNSYGYDMHNARKQDKQYNGRSYDCYIVQSDRKNQTKKFIVGTPKIALHIMSKLLK